MLFFVEMVAIALIVILEGTVGRIRFLGFVIVLLAQLVVFVSALVLSVLGFVKALAGERFGFPILEEYAARVPFESPSEPGEDSSSDEPSP